MKKILIIFLSVFLLAVFFYKLKIIIIQTNYLKTVPSQIIASNHIKNQFVGVWFSTRANSQIRINEDGTWKLGKYSGRWIIDGNDFVWTYHESLHNLYGKLDRNSIENVQEDSFVLKELDGSYTTFTRITKVQ